MARIPFPLILLIFSVFDALALAAAAGGYFRLFHGASDLVRCAGIVGLPAVMWLTTNLTWKMTAGLVLGSDVEELETEADLEAVEIRLGLVEVRSVA